MQAVKRLRPLTRRSPLRRPTTRVNRGRRSVEQAGRETVIVRAGGVWDDGKVVAPARCEVRSEVCTVRAWHVHHVLRRSAGATHDPTLMLATCVTCHEYLHAHVAEAIERGWLVSRYRAG